MSGCDHDWLLRGTVGCPGWECLVCGEQSERQPGVGNHRLVWLTLCRRAEPHRPHEWGYRRFCRGGWREGWR